MKRADVLAVDGGNSKTDLALVSRDGSVLALVRGPLSSPHHLGVEGCLAVLENLLVEAVREADLQAPRVAEIAELLMAGVDFPAEEETLREAVAARSWASSVQRRQRHVRSAAGGHRPRAGASPSRAAQGSTASASRPTAGTLVFPRSARSRATGAAATTSVSPRSPPRRAARTAVARARASSARCPAHFGLATPQRAGGGDPRRPRSSSVA